MKKVITLTMADIRRNDPKLLAEIQQRIKKAAEFLELPQAEIIRRLHAEISLLPSRTSEPPPEPGLP